MKILIKQHTPLIHFQHEQADATLRATELKPKLDKFVITKLKNEGKFSTDYLIGSGEKEALDYKLSILPVGEVKTYSIETIKTDNAGKPIQDRNGKVRKNSFPSFFANMGDENIDKKFSYCNLLELHFFSFNELLLIEIENNIAEFFAETNFGTRQSKGFGSFYPTKEISKGVVQKCYIPISKFYRYKFYSDLLSEDNHGKWNDLFETIDVFYRALRSGINVKGRDDVTLFYFKSLAFMYAQSLEIQWDKKTVKEKFFSGDLSEQVSKHSKSEILRNSFQQKNLIRDMFGLSSDEQWMSYRTSITKKHPTIERFKSPILFKPLFSEKEQRWYVYFKASEIPQAYLNQEFTIKKKNGDSFKLKTPEAFDLKDFFDFVFNRSGISVETHVDKKYHKHDNYTILYNAFFDIHENLKNHIL